MICQRCGKEFTDDGQSRVVRIAGLYSYQDDRYELCPKCLAKVKAFMDDEEIILTKKYTKINHHGGKVSSRVTGYEEVYV